MAYRLRRCIWPIAALVILAGCATSQPISELAERNWHEARTENFVVMTDAGEARARQLITDLEAFRRFVVQQGDLKLAERSLPFHIIAVNSYTDLQAIVGRNDVFGAFQQTYRGGFAAVNLAARGYAGTDSLKISRTPSGPNFRVSKNLRAIGLDGVFHEYVHHLLATDLTRRYPTWFHEGYAEYLSTFEYYPDGTMRIGQELPHRAEPYKPKSKFKFTNPADRSEKWIPLGALFNARGYENGHGQGGFYAQSWILVHYLMDKPERRAKLYAFLDRLNNPAIDAQPIFEEVWGESVETVASKVRQYARSARYRTKKFEPVDTPLPVPEIAVMRPGRMKERLAYAISQFRPQEMTEAYQLIDQAIIDDPTNIIAYATRANFAIARTDRADAARWLKASGHGKDTSAALQIIQGHLAALEISERLRNKRGGWEKPWQIARDSYARAIELDPRSAEGHAALARIHLFRDGLPPEEAVEAALRGKELVPTNFEVDLVLGHLRVKRGEWEAAASSYEQVIAWSRNPGTVSIAREMLGHVEAIFVELGIDRPQSQDRVDAAP